MSGSRTIIKNAAANVVSGGAAAILAVALPPFLVRLLPPAVFGAWALVLDVAALANLLRYGLQTAVGKYLAEAYELRQVERCDQLVNAALALLAGLGALAFLAVVVVAWQFGRWFHQVPAGLVPDARIALLLVGTTLALGLPFAVFGGIFTGQQRFEFPAGINGGCKLVLVVVLILIARAPHPTLEKLAWGWSAVMVASYGVQYWLCRWFGPPFRLSLQRIHAPAARELAGYSATLTVWSMAMLMISGLDTTLVGIFDFAAVGYYSIAVGLVTLLAGLQNSILSTLVPVGSVMSVKAEAQRQLGDLLVASTRYASILLVMAALPLLFLTMPLLRIWVGASYASHTAVLVQVLVVANCLRLSATPYAVLLIGTGQQRLVLISPLLEGVVNLGLSLWLGYRLGATGVALGTLIGAIVGVASNFLYNLPRTSFADGRLREYVCDGLMRPLACVLPAAGAFLALGYLTNPGLILVWFVAILSGLATSCCFWLVGLSGQDRQWLTARVFPMFQRLATR